MSKPILLARKLWAQLGNTPVNDQEEIDEDLDFEIIQFSKGTSIYEIWDWFEEEFNLSVAKDLMKL